MHPLDMRFKQLQAYVEKTCLEASSDEMRGHLYKFGLILICGYIEQSVRIIVMERLDKRAHPRVLNFVKSHFERGMNCNCATIEEILGRFDIGWRDRFCEFLNDNPDVRDGVASCYAVRNSVAHGGAQSLGSARLNELLQIGRRLVEGVVEATRY